MWIIRDCEGTIIGTLFENAINNTTIPEVLEDNDCEIEKIS